MPTVLAEKPLTVRGLMDRWGLGKSTLEGWRRNGKGPAWFKLQPTRNAKVFYRMVDVIKYERDHLQRIMV